MLMMLTMLIVIKNLDKKSFWDKVSKDKPDGITLNPQYDRCHRKIKRMVHKIFDKKPRSGINKNEASAHVTLEAVISD